MLRAQESGSAPIIYSCIERNQGRKQKRKKEIGREMPSLIRSFSTEIYIEKSVIRTLKYFRELRLPMVLKTINSMNTDLALLTETKLVKELHTLGE